MSWDEQGRVTLKDAKDVPLHTRKAIKKVKVTPTRMGNAIEIEMHDKVSALRMLSQHHGLLTPGLEQSSRPSVLGINLHGPNVTAGYSAQAPVCLLYTSPSPRNGLLSRMPSSA